MLGSTNLWKNENIRMLHLILLLSFPKMLHQLHGGLLCYMIQHRSFDMASSLFSSPCAALKSLVQVLNCCFLQREQCYSFKSWRKFSSKHHKELATII